MLFQSGISLLPTHLGFPTYRLTTNNRRFHPQKRTFSKSLVYLGIALTKNSILYTIFKVSASRVYLRPQNNYRTFQSRVIVI